MNAEQVLQLEKRLSYRGKDRIIMAAQTVIEHALADAGSRRGIKPQTYGTLVLSAAAVDRAALQGYVRWTLDDDTVEEAHWALASSGERVIVSRVDTLQRVTFPCNRIFKPSK